MKVDIIVGSSWGDEGKSKFARYYSDNVVVYDGVIKVGGYCTNNFYDWRSDQMMHGEMIPAAVGYKNEMYYFFPKDCYVDLNMVKKEAEMRKIPNDRIVIDPRANMIYPDNHIGAPDTDTEHIPFLVADVLDVITGSASDARFLIEGQGGYGIAKELYEECDLPCLVPTMTASGICHMVNISPTDVDDVILVTRLESVRKEYIGIGGANMLDQFIKGIYENPNYIATIESPETTPYNLELVKEASLINDPSIIVVNHMDSVDNMKTSEDGLSPHQKDVLKWIESQLGFTVDYVGYGESQVAELEKPATFESMIDQSNGRVVDLINKYNLKDGDEVPASFIEDMKNMTKNGEKIMIPKSRINGGNNDSRS